MGEFPPPPTALSRWYAQSGKRALDILLGLVALLMVGPLMMVLAGMIWLLMGGPVLFRQERPGIRGRLFTLYKFRTMIDSRDSTGRPLPDARRLTTFGRFLRGTSLDELPELVNVIRGEMSLVGPRPLLVRYSPYFRMAERARFLVRPGMTGLSQVSGRNDLAWDSRIALDVEYVNRCSPRLDLWILSLTAWRVIRRQGMRVDPGASMLDFDEQRQRRDIPPSEVP